MTEPPFFVKEVSMQSGFFYFIKDDFFSKYDNEKRLLGNKEGLHHRPCFLSFSDKFNPDILWCVPISSQVEKYRKIVQHKLEQQALKGIAHPKCNTIRFGSVLGQPRAFLIQNMFPVTAKYVDHVYLDRNTQKPVTISVNTQKDIIRNAKDILKLVQHGFDKLVFADILEMQNKLLEELHLDSFCGAGFDVF